MKGAHTMEIKITNDRGIGTYGVSQVAVVKLGKMITCLDPESPILDIKNGNEGDIQKLAKVGIVVEKISD
jgi:hypothetical protein